MKIAFASCNHVRKHPSQPAWVDLAGHAPDVLVLLGDNIYLEDHWWELYVNRPAHRLDDDGFAAYLHERYRRQWSVAEFQWMLQHLHHKPVEVLGTVDDHDFLGDGTGPTDEMQTKARISRLLHRQFIAACNSPVPTVYPDLPDWRNAPDPGFQEGLGLATARQYPDVGVVVLDNRSYREPEGLDRVALGRPQLSWLQRQLHRPQRVSLVFSGSPLTRGSKFFAPGSPLSEYVSEYRELRAIYKAYAGKNIIHVAGDLHYNEFKGRDVHRDFMEVCSSGLATGFLPFSSKAYGNYGLITCEPHQVVIETFGAQTSRNTHYVLPL